ncbi:MAG: helix-hairpin-helix domain-containing protein [candidate division KSB1 bacterium]|nr:helix-hairpin-helix domain-containing protein [candidate division KSB1 bacterium]MDZ7333603.1 helix-hairpin-helix domain-containing protein [candidate division KSB1 bacterium]MDZ7357823.1 helix-hairpin-helix domain-containing protein [candidate division KSB1 bacterium]MDZ7398717.1 helix-hairpin-helix domain-containing protein [candidate division KSB1 bacterium]
MKVKQIISPAPQKQTFVIIQCFLLFFSSTVDASFELKGSSARVQGLGLAYVGLANTPEAIFINSSGLAQLKGFASSIYYTRPFGLKELNYGSIVAMAATPPANVALGCLHFGNELYSEQSFILALARPFRNNFFYGINLHYMKLQITGYGSDFSLAFDGGFLAKLNDHLSWGFFATNITRARMGASKDQLPQTICSGFSYVPCNDLVLNIDIFKDVNFPLELRLGIEYRLLNRLALRTGIVSEPTQFACGIGFFFSRFTVDYAMTTHQILGLSHHVSLQVQTKSKPVSVTPVEPLKPSSQNEITIKININTADEKSWQQLPGIGPKLARRIVEYRLQVGQFNSIEELSHVKGISKSKLEKLKPYLTLDQN